MKIKVDEKTPVIVKCMVCHNTEKNPYVLHENSIPVRIAGYKVVPNRGWRECLDNVYLCKKHYKELCEKT